MIKDLQQRGLRDPRGGRPDHPAAAGARHRHRRRLQDDRRGSGPARASRRWSRRPTRWPTRPTARRDQQRLRQLQHQDAAHLRRHRPHQGRDAGRARHRRVRHPADLSGLDLRQRLQPTRPHLPGLRAGRRAVPQRAVGDRRAEDPLGSGAMVPLGAVVNLQPHHRPLPRAALQPLSLAPRSRATPRRATPAARRWRRWSGWRRRRLPPGFGYEWTELALQQKHRRQHRRPGVRPGGGVRLPGAGRALRERDPAVLGDPDRADVPAGGA